MNSGLQKYKLTPYKTKSSPPQHNVSIMLCSAGLRAAAGVGWSCFLRVVLVFFGGEGGGNYCDFFYSGLAKVCFLHAPSL